MKLITYALIMSGVWCLPSLNSAQGQTIASVVVTSQHNSGPAANTAHSSNSFNRESPRFDNYENARTAILPLLRGVFNTRWNGNEVLLTIDAGWRSDSLSIEYKYYKGNNLLVLDENLLVEKIYFTCKPGDIDALDTELDEFQFLYLRNKKKLPNFHQLVNRPPAVINEEHWCSSFGFPVRIENLPIIIQLLKDLRAE